ncbi:hypothetical protein MRT22_05550 [Escherichia coli]|uniref:Protein YtjE n=1 Tax=Escherichia coli (strain K12) TaxID=83333 RepID=YTJE_ECOLI|nr:protein YtjE [Escherichia coli str. K-12 substr. MG1655] [Escherichia coli]YP_010283921.1 protein YtjE [Escherichia coli str. K-12 substr. MG1655]P0DV23.1 RecName: Full=Protein YtjE [Escherichia coli K-12]MCI6425095.1 hypothetical protein [Shigella flexneri]MCI7295876.1 hypothetical protein [Shigella dysenteriae]MDC3429218.1 hypothetical protein [Escherichia sp. S10b]MCI4466610.1 hypothetical protein [Escherichia coli]MCI4472149.1 hypothetical protein [Escherichia coli]
MSRFIFYKIILSKQKDM